MKYDCLKTSGVKHGSDYCRDINSHRANTTTPNFFKCYRKYGVEYSDEYCDYENGGDDDDFNKSFEEAEDSVSQRKKNKSEKINVYLAEKCFKKACVKSNIKQSTTPFGPE